MTEEQLNALENEVLNELYKYHSIAGKDVFTVVSHHHALLPWSIIRRRLSSAPNLITLDHHTDTLPPFLLDIYIKYESQREDLDRDASMRASLLQKISWRNEDTVRTAISRLHHDEHIRTGTQTDILNYAFVIHLEGSCETQSIEMKRYEKENPPPYRWGHEYPPSPIPPYTYDQPEDKTFILPSNCSVGYYNRVIEGGNLSNLLKIVGEMAQAVEIPNFETTKYILDIDLDYFHTNKAIEPDDPSVFYRLIRNAEAITIAIEEECTLKLQSDGENISVQTLLMKLDEHIAMAQNSEN
jgi:hypothetical protein